MTDLRDRIAKLLYARTMSRLAWHRAWDDLQPDVQQMWLDNLLRETVGTLTDSVEKLLHMQESTTNISKTHTLWLERIGKRVGKLEDRLSPPSEAVEDADRTQKDDDPHTQELIDFGLWLSKELTGTPISRIDLESCLDDWRSGDLADFRWC